MFNGCSQLEYVKALFTDDPNNTVSSLGTKYQRFTHNWLKGVAAND